jgi:hypothetical protein
MIQDEEMTLLLKHRFDCKVIQCDYEFRDYEELLCTFFFAGRIKCLVGLNVSAGVATLQHLDI